MFSCDFCEIFKTTNFAKYKRRAAFENHVYLNSIGEFSEFQSDDVNNFCLLNRECLYSENTRSYEKQSPRGDQACNFFKKETLEQVLQ